MKSRLLSLLLFLACAGTLPAQAEYFVDPTSGNDVSSGSQGSPFRTLGHAMTVSVVGDSVYLRAGTYTGVFETFPIQLKDNVSVLAFDGEEPIFDGGGAGTLFQLAEDITLPTLFLGVTLSNCTVGFEIPAGTGVNGMTIRDCDFNNFADSGPGADDGFGILAVLDSGGTSEFLAVDSCTFAGNTARDAIAIQVLANTNLDGGGILDNTSSGGVDRTVSVLARSGATVDESFGIHRNVFSGYLEAGIFLHAFGSGGNPFSVARILSASNANFLSGNGLVENGYHLRAEHGVLGEGAVVSPWISFGRISGNDVNVLCETVNGGGDLADIEADFYANRIEDAGRAGVEMSAIVPTAGNANNDPNFGPGHSGRFASINTFSGNGSDLRFGAGVANTISAQFNFFPDGSPSQFGGTADVAGIMSDTLSGGFASSVLPAVAGQVQLDAASDSAFVDYDDAGNTGQIIVTLDGTELAQSDISALPLGAGLLLQLPALTAGTKTVVVTNPGGQSGSFNLNVSLPSLGDALADNDCFVATAAHGDYGSHEVHVLRRFRDQYLKTNPAGNAFVDWYYDHGPSGAAFLLEHEWARKGARGVLVLPVLVADGITSWNPGQRYAFGVLMLGLAFRLVRRR
ncbi:MAG: CFI-box-CTERM domain-containing protein [Planctomycetota bacterium]